MRERLLEWLKLPVNRLELILVLLLLMLLSCKNPNVHYYESKEELDSLFDYDNVSSLETRNLLDTIDKIDSITTEGKDAMDSIARLILHEEEELLELETADAATGNALKRVVVHCTASNIINPHTKESLLRFFKETQHWSKPGYTFFFDRNGVIWKLNQHWDWDPIVNYSEITFGAKGYNSTSLHIAWDGGLEGNKIIDNRTKEQKSALLTFIRIARDIYPNIEVIGHRDLPGVTKLCPIFDVKKEYKNL
jgi:N-acetylmuramoyl-L-alanine amidase